MTNKFFRTIEEILADWGQKQRQLPPRNEALRSEILAKLQPAAPKALPQSHHLPWFSIAFSGLAIISLFINYLPFTQRMPAPIPLTRIEEGGKMSTSSIRSEYYPYPQPDSGIPITDTREFTKTDYNATIRTRKVEELVYRIKLDVREFFDGRVDSSSSSKRSGYVSFVVPANKFEDFRWAIKSLAGERFLIENVYTENLLPEKQSIEQQEREIGGILTQLKSDRNKLISSHKRTVASIQSKIDKINSDLTALKIKLDVTSDPTKREQLKAQERELLAEKADRETELADENSVYTRKLNNLNTQIRDNETVLDGIIRQDQKLIDTVATVRGTIYLNWISIWEVIRLYAPINLGFLLFTATAVIAYLVHRHRRSYLFLPN